MKDTNPQIADPRIDPREYNDLWIIPKGAFKKRYRAIRTGTFNNDSSMLMIKDWPEAGRLIIEKHFDTIEWWTSNGNIYSYILK